MRVCYFGTYEEGYPRNEIFIAGMRQAGITVYECHESIWKGQRDKTGVHRGLSLLIMLVRIILAYVRLTVRYLRMPGHEVVMVGYIGQLDMLLAWLLTRLRAKPLVFNPMLSIYDTFCNDRDLVRPDSLAGRVLRLLDHLSCRAADMVLLDTQQHVDYFVQTFHLPATKFRVVPVGADDRLFNNARKSATSRRDQASSPCQVLFVGKFIPLHGCETIVRAAKLLRNDPVHITMVGSGQERERIQQLVREQHLSNITLVDWVEYDQLPSWYAQADICLGIFGNSAKASRVIPNKVYQALAMARPIITADTPAVRSELEPGHALWVCNPADPEDLAQQIATLANDAELRNQVATAGYETFQQRYSMHAIASTLFDCLSEIIPGFTPEDTMTWGDQPSFYGPRHRFRENYLFQAVCRYAPGPTVLDAACGAGSLVRRLSGHNYRVIGLDLSTSFLRHIQSQPGGEQISLLQSDITALPCEDGQVDAVVAGEVLEHLEDDVTPLREFWRVLRPGGVCVISVPAEPNQWDWHDNWAGHVRRYRREEMQQLLESQGFQIINLHHFGFPLVRAFHTHIYLPRYRRNVRAYQGNLAGLSVSGMRQKLLARVLLLLFQVDHLFNRWPLGIGLIAVAQKPYDT
jgi:glycosyltransferase involved in cell wall biosynthesis/2-polyprenyl-3-methyl-5-hydroxy-6-metoxy-1,4-benzoquinol methylase